MRVRKAFSMTIDRKLITDNVAKARNLLAEADYPNDEDFPSAELLYNASENYRKIATIIQRM